MILEKGQDTNDFSQSGDIGANNITIFANFVEFGGEEQSIFETNAYTYLYIKGAEEVKGYTTSKQNKTTLEVDNDRIDGSKMKMRNRTNLSFISDRNLMPLFNKSTILFTENEPLNPTKYINQEQEVYVSETAIPNELNEKINGLEDALKDAVKKLEEAKNITMYNLVNIKDINNITNSVVLFTTFSPIVNPTKLTITYDKSYASHKIFAKGKVNGIYQDINIKDKSKILYAWMKLTPISINNKVSFKSNNMDKNNSLPYGFLKTWLSIDKGLRIAIVNDEQEFKKELWTLFLQILELTKAFSNGFADYQIKGSDGRSGIDPEYKMGNKKIGLLSGTSSRDAMTAIDGWIESWKSDFPQFVDSNEFKIFKVFLNMLSPFVQSSYAIGGGLNKMNRINDIFYFDLRTAISKGLSNKNTNDIIVQLKSEFYDIDINNKLDENYGYLYMKDKYKELSIYKVLDLDGEVSFAELPEQLQELNIPSKPGSMQITNDDSSKYYVMVPVSDQKELQEFYGELKNEVNKKSKVITKTFQINRETKKQIDNGSKGLSEKEWKKAIEEDWNSYKNNNLNNLYFDYLKNNLSPEEEIKFINGIPDIKNLRHKSELIDFHYSSKTEFNTSISSYGPQSHSIKYISVVYPVFFEYTVISKTKSKDLSFNNKDTIYDKQKYTDLVKLHYSSQEKIIKELDFNYSNPNNTINNISQLRLSGIFGNSMSFRIEGKDAEGKDAVFESNEIEFHSKFKETNTLLKINF